MKVKSPIYPHNSVVWLSKPNDYPMRSEKACRSKIQYEVGRYLVSQYPLDIICEEVPIPDTRLSLDFYIPTRHIAVEVQGEQHERQIPFFQKNPGEFYKQKERDEKKVIFCDLNGINLIIVKNVEELKELDLWNKKN